MQQWPQRSDEAAVPTLSQLPSLSCWSHDVNGTDSPMAFSIYELVQATHGLTGDPAQVPAPGFTQGPWADSLFSLDRGVPGEAVWGRLIWIHLRSQPGGVHGTVVLLSSCAPWAGHVPL